MEKKIMDVLRVHFAGLTMNVLCACVSQAIWSGFDASFLWIMCHEIFEAGTELLIASCILNGSIFLGSIIAATALRRWNDWLCTFTVSCIKAMAILVMGFIPNSISFALFPLLFISGVCIGITQSILISYSMHKCATIQNSILIPVIYACFASGSFVSSILLEFGHTDKTHSKNPFQSFNVIESMQVQTRYPANILLTISAAFQLSTLYPVYALWKSTAADPNREEYEDLTTPAAKNLIGVFMLTSIMGFFVNSLRNIFPYYMFAYMNEESSVIYYVTFMAAFTCGRFANIGFSRKNLHSVILAISLVGCGVSICCFSYPELRLVSSAIFGFSLSIVLPTLTLFLMELKGTSIHPLICGSTFGPLAFPLLVTQVFNNFGKELFTSVNFFSLLLIVFLFVCLLNVQSKMDKPQDESSAKVWKWFRGEGTIRRARSFRKFVSNVRASFRGSRYRRLNKNINSQCQTPTPLTDISPLARSPSPNPKKTYRTVKQSRSGRLHTTSIEEEFSSIS